MHNGNYDIPTQSLSALTHGEPSDEELMTRIQKQDEQALGALYHRHTALLRTIVARVINNDHDVDDLIQEVFIEIWRQAPHFDQAKGKALGWIVTLGGLRVVNSNGGRIVVALLGIGVSFFGILYVLPAAFNKTAFWKKPAGASTRSSITTLAGKGTMDAGFTAPPGAIESARMESAR